MKWNEITALIESYPVKSQRSILAVVKGQAKYVLQGYWDGENFISFNGSTLWKKDYTVKFWMEMPPFPIK